MRKAALIYNPASGTRRNHRQKDVEIALAELHHAGVNAIALATSGVGSACDQVLRLLADGYDTLVACGGDGTINEVLQGLMVSNQKAALGTIPFGSGNLLARELGIPAHPAKAARALLTAEPKCISAAMMEMQSQSGQVSARYWIAAAGVGADAHVICKINQELKARYGIYAYYAESAKQLLLGSYDFPPFIAEFAESGSNVKRREIVSQIVAERINYFGRCLSSQNGHGLSGNELQVILFKTPRRWSYFSYGLNMLQSLLTNNPYKVRDIEVVRVRELTCRGVQRDDGITEGWSAAGKKSGKILAEADGELLGSLPVRINIVPDAIAILCPAKHP